MHVHRRSFAASYAWFTSLTNAINLSAVQARLLSDLTYYQMLKYEDVFREALECKPVTN
jgi:hypothetical protein